jgi:NAD(P)-dependent dehydrogenase (short-subunit alcohol dehydrogenase family)
MKPLLGKWALVTGSSRGIGQQIAKGLSQEGCNVILHGRIAENLKGTQRLLEKYETEVSIVAGDLGADEGVEAVIRGVDAGPGHIDILYNNAAIQNEWQPVWEIPRSVWQEAFQVNVYALIAMCNAFAPGMVERGYGRIINLTSGIKDTPNLAPYGVSKAAVDKYTLDLAAELRGTNVLANTLDPGWLRTDMGGPNGEHEVTTVLPGALVPALLEDNGPSGQRYSAQDYRAGE